MKDLEKGATKCHYPKPKSKMKPIEDSEEIEAWVPQGVLKIGHEFRAKYAQTVSKSMMNQLLEDMNRIWREREKTITMKVRKEATTEVQQLRRELAFNKPYDQKMKDQEIKRLKDQLKQKD